MEYHMNTHKLHTEFSDPGNNSVILHMLCLVTHYFVKPLLFHCTVFLSSLTMKNHHHTLNYKWKFSFIFLT